MIFVYCIVLLISFLCCAHDEELFLQGHAAYEQQQFEQAIRCYSTMRCQGPGVLYNLGNCYYCLGDYIQALAYWHRALLTGYVPVMDLSNHNCIHAYNKMRIPFFQHISGWFIWLLKYHILLWQIIFVCLWYLILYLLWRYSLRKLWWFIILILFCMAVLGGMFYHWYQYQHTQWAIVPDALILRTGPYSHCTEKDIVPKATIVALQESQGEWIKVCSGKMRGWVPAASLVKL